MPWTARGRPQRCTLGRLPCRNISWKLAGPTPLHTPLQVVLHRPWMAAGSLCPGAWASPLGAACCSAGSGPTWRALSQEHARLGAARPAWARPLRYSCRNNQRGTKERKRKSSTDTTRFTLNPKTPEGTGGKGLHSQRIPVQNSKIHGEFLTLERKEGEPEEPKENRKGATGTREPPVGCPPLSLFYPI